MVKWALATSSPGRSLDVIGDIRASNKVEATVVAAEELYINDVAFTTHLDSTVTANAYWAAPNENGQLSYEGGNVGIGTVNPQSRLDVAGDVSVSGKINVNSIAFSEDPTLLGDGAGLGLINSDKNKHVFIGKGAGARSGFNDPELPSVFDSKGGTNYTGEQYLQNFDLFVLNNSEKIHKPLLFGRFSVDHDLNTDEIPQLGINTHHLVDSCVLTVSGAMHVGPQNLEPTVFPSSGAYSDALLWVERGIVTEDLIFSYSDDWSSWPDYVFEDDYQLQDLEEVEAFIETHKHLPGVRSRETIDSPGEGAPVKETMLTLLEKVEELTLHLIDQNKRIESQQRHITELQDELKALSGHTKK